MATLESIIRGKLEEGLKERVKFMRPRPFYIKRVEDRMREFFGCRTDWVGALGSERCDWWSLSIGAWLINETTR